MYLFSIKKSILMLCVCGFALAAQAQAPEWRSAASGNFNNTTGTVWERLVSGVWTLQAASSKPGGGANVTIRSGHTVTVEATQSILNLTIESGATLNADVTSPTTRTLRVGVAATGGATNNTVVLLNNGTLGSTTGTGDGINLEVGTAAANFTIQGTGITKISRFRTLYPNPNTPATININQNMDVVINNNYAFSAYYNNAANTATEQFIVNIAAGKTVKLYAGGYFHGGSSAPSNPQGSVTYNINGTLDLSATTSGGFITSTSGTPSLALNIKNGGLLKLGTAFSAYKGSAAGSLSLIIENGGTVDGTLLTNSFGNNGSAGYAWFVTQGTGVFKQTVGSTSVTVPVGTATSYNPITLNNGGGTVFSVSVSAGHSPATLTDASKAINRTWQIIPAATPATADITLGYNTADANVACFPSAPMSLIGYGGTAWGALGTTTPAIGGSGTDYTVGYAGITAFSAFTLGNQGTLPVSWLGISAQALETGNALTWQTADEKDNHFFWVESSINGIDFQRLAKIEAASVKQAVQSYTYLDAQAAAGLSYYRVVQYDTDGKQSYSKVVSVYRSKSVTPTAGMRCFPTLVSDVFMIENIGGEAAQVIVRDIQGRIVHAFLAAEGATLHTVQTAQWPSGTYYISAKTSKGVENQRIIKQ